MRLNIHSRSLVVATLLLWICVAEYTEIKQDLRMLLPVKAVNWYWKRPRMALIKRTEN